MKGEAGARARGGEGHWRVATGPGIRGGADKRPLLNPLKKARPVTWCLKKFFLQTNSFLRFVFIFLLLCYT